METKHTPGPWFYAGRSTLYIDASIDGGMIQEIAAVGPTAADNGYGETQQANARLIAAAPDLLEKCEMALSYIEAVCFNTPNPKKRKNYADCAGQLRAAIAKATGEQE